MKTIIAACSQNLSGSRASIQATLRTLLAAPWPSQRDIHSWLQLLSVLQWVLSFLLLGIVSLMLLIYLVFTSFWPISALYLAWIIFDWDTPEKGGRRLPCLRRWTVWRHFRDYFPVKLVKTHDLSPSHNYIIGSHPHGILCVGAFCNFITGSTGFEEMFPGIRPFLTTLAGNFRLPIFREYLMSGGLCPVTRRAIGYLLSKNGTGNAVAIVIGGAAESLSCRPGITTLTLKNRKGFVRLALQHGAHLVPSFSFGENDLFRQVVFEEGSWMRSIQQRFQKMMGFAPCVFYGRGLTSIQSRGFLPYAKPITTVVGEPVTVPKIEDPSSEVVDMYHEMYIRSLLKLFNENKTKYGLLETDELHIL
ncbi:diacylglycerol O-acyltransferase 2-like isoform X1 [Pezoporus wallicus]|uniref:diacylglycerol O-acyltransferase 2-like isoform X1 n=2 Tax=Pezoporus wallicus TaxID=35540 RepID=UPI002551298D|nr:diacylglycerol O-acyltransferase 2-like isoform X1 [Pezoporus wallicus]XP_061301631.1 diacylglycerol O-acyltransferase 2-like isoform X1 [Pezoporus flaviventris]